MSLHDVRSDEDVPWATPPKRERRKQPDVTGCLRCGKPLVQRHTTNRKKYHPECRHERDRELAAQYYAERVRTRGPARPREDPDDEMVLPVWKQRALGL